MDLKNYTKTGVVDVKDASDGAPYGKKRKSLCHALRGFMAFVWRVLGLAREITANLAFCAFHYPCLRAVLIKLRSW